MTANTLALRPIGYRFIGDRIIPFYSVDPGAEGIMSNAKSGSAKKMIKPLVGDKKDARGSGNNS